MKIFKKIVMFGGAARAHAVGTPLRTYHPKRVDAFLWRSSSDGQKLTEKLLTNRLANF